MKFINVSVLEHTSWMYQQNAWPIDDFLVDNNSELCTVLAENYVKFMLLQEAYKPWVP